MSPVKMIKKKPEAKMVKPLDETDFDKVSLIKTCVADWITKPTDFIDCPSIAAPSWHCRQRYNQTT